MLKGLVLKALNRVFLTSKADSFLKFFFFNLGIINLDGSSGGERNRCHCGNLRAESIPNNISI